MGKSKFHVFAEKLIILPSLTNNLKRYIQLYNCILKLLHIFQDGIFSIEFEEDIQLLYCLMYDLVRAQFSEIPEKIEGNTSIRANFCM